MVEKMNITGYNMFMNFSIHIDDKTAAELDQLSKKTGRKRNSLIREAIEKLLQSDKKSHWPKEVLELAGAAKDLPPFESYRKEFPPEDKDPFA